MLKRLDVISLHLWQETSNEFVFLFLVHRFCTLLELLLGVPLTLTDAFNPLVMHLFSSFDTSLEDQIVVLLKKPSELLLHSPFAD